jgi:hypothetical protein
MRIRSRSTALGASLSIVASAALVACAVGEAATDSGPAAPPPHEAPACRAGTADCNRRPGDGCEARLSEDPANCGSCGARCPSTPRSLPVCLEGRCAWACRVGYGECDGDRDDPCETSTLTDPCHCNGCGRRCPPGQFCVAGLCQPRQDPLVQRGPRAPAVCP